VAKTKSAPIRIIRDKKTLAKSSLLCIIVFMSENRTTCHGEGRGRSRIRSPQKAVISLNTLLLRRKAQ